MRFVVASCVLSVALWASERPGADDVARGDRALRRRALVEASQYFLKARAADPKNAAIYRRLASVAERAGSFADAGSFYDQCARMDKRDAECRRGSGRVARRLKTTVRR